MTPEERADALQAEIVKRHWKTERAQGRYINSGLMPPVYWYKSDLVDAIAAAVAEEREECASWAHDLIANGVVILSADEVAAAIRARRP